MPSKGKRRTPGARRCPASYALALGAGSLRCMKDRGHKHEHKTKLPGRGNYARWGPKLADYIAKLALKK